MKGAVAGLVGGLVAAWVMNQFQAALSKVAKLQQQDEGENATVKTAGIISTSVAGRRLTKKDKETAGPIVHYAFGSMVGAFYGALAELAPPAKAVWGFPFSAALWFGADEVAVPALGLSKSPSEYPVSTHASALAAQLVYGVTSDVVRQVVRAALP